MVFEDGSLVDWRIFQHARSELASDFPRILGYFREDGVKSLNSIEEAMRALNAAAMVVPAHTLKGDSSMFGAMPLATLAEAIEDIARLCLEAQETPGEALEYVAALRPLFVRTLALLEREISPLLVERRPAMVFGRRML
ncbi:Hpt domain-containing protein [Sphingomonas qilianensis]|uniref:Hpt domain-containing protein n=1 Tax=Sphingomonas qilianensis TaxID=1736690 RepID=A0ABU9XVB3_9SPHN